MPFCFNCFQQIDSFSQTCPHCGAPPLKEAKEEISKPPEKIMIESALSSGSEDVDAVVKVDIERLLKRGIECFNNGKAWLATKNSDRARKDFQRALRYFDQVLKMDSTNSVARDYRAKASQKIS